MLAVFLALAVHQTSFAQQPSISSMEQAKMTDLMQRAQKAWRGNNDEIAEPLVRELIGAMLSVENLTQAQKARALVEVAKGFAKLDNHPAASIVFAAAVPMNEQFQQANPEYLAYIMREFVLSLNATDRFAEGLSWIERSEQIAQRSGQVREFLKFDVAHTKARSLIGLGRDAEAEKIVRTLLATAGNLDLVKKQERIFTLQGTLATTLSNQGKRLEAIEIYRNQISQKKSLTGVDDRSMLVSSHNYGVELYLLNRYLEAATVLKDTIQAKIDAFGASDKDLAVSYNMLARVQLSLKDYSAAETSARNAMRLRTALLGENDLLTIQTLELLATITEVDRDLTQAVIMRAMIYGKLLEKVGRNHPATLNAQFNYGLLGLKSGNRAGAIDASRAFEEILSVKSRQLTSNHPDLLEYYNALAASRLAANETGKPALEPARIAAKGVRQNQVTMGFGAAETSQRELNQSSKRIFFKNLANALWNEQREKKQPSRELVEEVFQAFQDIGATPVSGALAAAIARQAVAAKGPNMEALISEREKAQRSWQLASDALGKFAGVAAKSDAGKFQSLTSALRAQEAVMTTIDAKLRQISPEYFDLLRPKKLTIAEVQSALKSDEAFLMVIPMGFGTHVLAITNSQVTWRRSEWNASDVNVASKRLLWDVGAPVDVTAVESADWMEEGEGAYPFDRSTSFELYRNTVDLVADALDGKKFIYEVSTGSLAKLPLHLLVSSPPLGQDGDPKALRETDWLMKKYAIMKLPSVHAISIKHTLGRSSDGNEQIGRLVGFGDPELDGSPGPRGAKAARAAGNRDRTTMSVVRSVGGLANTRNLKSLARLPGTAEELGALQNALSGYKSQINLQGEATETLAKSTDYSDVSILVFATHGLLAGEMTSIAEPGLVLSPPQSGTAIDDGFLSSSEIAELRIPANWVILSACNTASSDGTETAEGLSGIAKSFFYAGSKALLVSHWPVRDDVAPEITVPTVTGSAGPTNRDKAKSFQLAMMKIMQNRQHDNDNDTWAHPSVWAPFSLVVQAE